ncbi:MAG: hypothetical protein ACJ74W_23615 [Pyrinomonadaceae bacterium]
MRVIRLSKLFFICAVLLLLFKPTLAGNIPSAEAAKLLPDRIGNFRASQPASSDLRVIKLLPHEPKDLDITSAASRLYRAPDGAEYLVTISQHSSDAGAYAWLTGNRARMQFEKVAGVGTYGFITPQHALGFYKGTAYVLIFDTVGRDNYPDNYKESLISFARSLAQTLDSGTGIIPPLVSHLPGDEQAQERATYAINLSELQGAVSKQPVLEVLSFDGGTEAVAAKYDQGQLVTIEFQTPQLASDADARITARIAELRAQNQPVPAAYRREGNYAVFVFDAPNEQAAQQLAGQVKYEKVVQWLGDDPHRFERANRFWLNMSGSIILNTIKATGLAIILCLSVGGLFGGVIFMRRRAQAALSERYSDAGGMMRLNLDELAGAQNGRPQLLPRRDE